MPDPGRHSAKMAARMVIPAKTLWANNFFDSFPEPEKSRIEVRRLEFPKA
jgi:hypothetical protein